MADHQTLQDGNIQWALSFRKVTWPFDRLILQAYVTN